MMTEEARFEHCGGCPSGLGCAAARYCVIERRFHGASRVITSPVCGACQRSADSGAWACIHAGVEECAAQSDLWGQWFLVQIYARDEQDRLKTEETRGRP